MSFQEYSYGVRFLQTVRRIIRNEIQKMYSVRIATVNSWDRTTRTSLVYFVEAPNTIIRVNMGGIQPKTVGQKVRIEKYDGDWFLTDIITGGVYMVP